MHRKIKDLIKDLKKAGFVEVSGGGKGSHRKFNHDNVAAIAVISGKSGDDAKPYQEKDVKTKIEESNN